MTDHPFAAEAKAVKRALALPGAIAADLSLLGGVLRCGECGGEKPLGDTAAYLRSGWPSHCGKAMTWVTLRELTAERIVVPEGHELAAVPDDSWRLDPGRPCVRKTAGRRACREPSAAALNRRHTRTFGYQRPAVTVDSWWPYCPAHAAELGAWVENGRVWHWVLREVTRGDA